MRGGDPMPPELAKGKWLMPWDSKSLVQQIELGEDSRVEFEEAGFAGNRVRAPRRETVSSAGGSLTGAQVVALYPNKTWMEGELHTILAKRAFDEVAEPGLFEASFEAGMLCHGGAQFRKPLRHLLHQSDAVQSKFQAFLAATCINVEDNYGLFPNFETPVISYKSTR